MAHGKLEQAPEAQEMDLVAPWEAELQRHRAGFAAVSEERPAKKTVYFMRHAESTSNVHKRNLTRHPCASCQLCSVGFDAPLSQEGLAQLQEVRAACQTLLPELQAVLHSPLQRAEQTARCTFGAEEASGDFAGGTLESAVPWVPLACLKEEQFDEHIQEPGCNIFGGHRMKAGVVTSSEKFRRRITQFLEFVWDCRFERLALVGHSLWFRALMDIAGETGQTVHVQNASVWRLTLSPPPEAGGTPRITGLELVAAPDAKPSKKAGEANEPKE